MIEFLLQFKDILLPILGMAGANLLIGLGMVYLFGRMLEVAKSDKVRNFIAFISIFMFTFFTNYHIIGYTDIYNLIFDTLLYGFSGIISYVLIGFRLFSRVDAFLDRKFSEDNYKSSSRKKKTYTKKSKK